MYLGIVIYKFKARLSSWKVKCLYVGRRLILIKTMIGSIGIYYMSLFKTLANVLNNLEKFRSQFFGG